MSHGKEVIRESDGALLGYVRPTGGPEWVPCTVFGHPLGTPVSYEEAVAEVERRGLSCLSDRWWFRDESDGRWYACTLQEATPSRVEIRVVDFGHPDPYARIVIEDPDPGRLRLDQPSE